MKKLRNAAWLAVLCACALYAGLWLSQQRLGPEGGDPAPALSLTDLAGKAHALSDYRGQLLLVNFWATWCAPCIHEMPLLVEAQKAYGARGLVILGPALDDAEAAKRMAAQLGVNYPVMADYAQVDAAMRALGNGEGALPYTVLISPEGRMLEAILGGLKADQLRELIEKNLPSTSS